jgi:hypothetical protein
MNKTIITLLLVMLMALSVSEAIVMPCPVFGKVTNGGTPVTGVTVTFQDVRTGVTSQAVTDKNGVYQFELANIDAGYSLGSQVKVSVEYCNANSDCVKTISLAEINKVDINAATPPVCGNTTPAQAPWIAGILAMIAGGGIVIITNGTKKAKIQQINGETVVTHSHPTVSGYHDIQLIHKKQAHKAGEIYPNYVKNASGVYEYKG